MMKIKEAIIIFNFNIILNLMPDSEVAKLGALVSFLRRGKINVKNIKGHKYIKIKIIFSSRSIELSGQLPII